MPSKAKVNENYSGLIKKDLGQIALKIKTQRKALGFTQDQLAEKMECDLGTIQAWENSRRVPSLPTFLVLVRVLKLKMSLD